jgi:hypothetical protein
MEERINALLIIYKRVFSAFYNSYFKPVKIIDSAASLCITFFVKLT